MNKASIVFVLVFYTGCAYPDLARPIDTSMAVPFGVFFQNSQPISRYDLADELSDNAELETRTDLFYGFTYPAIILGVGAVGTGLAVSAQDENHAREASALRATSLGLVIGAAACELLARVFLWSAAQDHNTSLRTAASE